MYNFFFNKFNQASKLVESLQEKLKIIPRSVEYLITHDHCYKHEKTKFTV